MSGPLARTLARVSDVLRRLEDAALVLLLSAMILIGGAQIVMRNLLGQALSGADESQRLIVLWLAVLGAVAASRDRKQLRIDLVSRYLKGRVRLALEAFADLLTAAVAGVIAWYSIDNILANPAATRSGFSSLTDGRVPSPRPWKVFTPIRPAISAASSMDLFSPPYISISPSSRASGRSTISGCSSMISNIRSAAPSARWITR
mgnify:CR=1 FL=1